MAEPAKRGGGGARSGQGPDADGSRGRRCAACGARYPLDFVVCPKDATPLELPPAAGDPLVGEVLAGCFRITRTLGEGGMGRVYEAEHVRLPRRFAVKVMLDRMAAHPDAVARFEREAQAVARIVNPHVLDVVDVLRARGRPCMVTELLHGMELATLLERDGKVPLPTAIAICRQVCRGLAAAHAVGVVHRDLKPSNLFLSDQDGGVPFVKILDFGVAKLADGTALTQSGMVLGTPAYMAPEQARGSSRVDLRADVYAVGAVLYHMLTGQPPFGSAEPAMALTRVLSEDPRRPRDLDRSIPEDVEVLIQRAMARDPAQRPGTALELDHLLAAFDEPQARRTVMATAQTVAVPALPNDMDEVTRRARGARPAALVRAVVFSVVAGSSVLVVSATALRIAGGGAAFSETEIVLVGVLSLAMALFLFLAAVRVLASRWRSAPAVVRLGSALRLAVLWLVVPLAMLTLGSRAAALFGPALPRDLAPAVEIGIVGLPLLLGLVVFAMRLSRAHRT
jgi:serine/threonine-protein kinase